MRTPIILLTAALLFLAQHAAAETITECGASDGTAYYFEGPITPEAESGWQKDQISKGEFRLIMDGDQPDIIATDALNRTFSALGDGAAVIELKGTDAHFRLIVVIYPQGAVEHFIFRLDAQGAGKVVWGSAKVGGPIPKSSLMEATCHKP